MPKTKVKTHKATAKRIRQTKSGKVLRKPACSRHMLSKKSSRQKRRLAETREVTGTDKGRYVQLLGGKK